MHYGRPMCSVAWPGYFHTDQYGQIFFKQKYIAMPPAQRRVGWLVRWLVMCGDLARSRPRDHRQCWSSSGGAQAAAVSTQLSSVTQQVGSQNNPHTDVRQCCTIFAESTYATLCNAHLSLVVRHSMGRRQPEVYTGSADAVYTPAKHRTASSSTQHKF